VIFDLALQELRRDPCFPSLSVAQQQEYIVSALAMGREQGERYRGRGVLALVTELGARFVIRDEEGVIAGLPTRAEYDSGTGLITVYRPSIESLDRMLGETPRIEEAESLALRVLIAHELFHHLEATRIPPVSEQLPSVIVSRFAGWWKVRRHVRSCSEIAAHAFAQTLMDLPFLPNLLDTRIPNT
jgi:hypothetical protein